MQWFIDNTDCRIDQWFYVPIRSNHQHLCSHRWSRQHRGCSFTVTITDNEDPQIICPASSSVNTDASMCSAVVNYSAPVGTDNCSGSLTTQTAGLTSGSMFPLGVTTNTFVVSDGAGNTAVCSFTVTVTDNEDPHITCPASSTVDTDVSMCSAVVNYTAPVGSDNCSGAMTMQTTGLSGGSMFPLGVTTNTFVVSDGSGNTAACSFTVTVTDNEDPQIIVQPCGWGGWRGAAGRRCLGVTTNLCRGHTACGFT
ncbi:MAG: HYR domain-containing protein [Saprospiraceae bacterium]|nr:HYR domain-containing protein [Saprospiraceae bacterium]